MPKTRISLALPASAIALLLLSGCASRGGSVPYAPAGFDRPDVETIRVPTGVQPIVPTDKLQVTVFQEPELSGEFQVDSMGRIDFPLLGPINVQGRTAEEASEMVRTRLAEKYLRDPKVQVAITEPAARTITVEGAVGRSGVFPIQGPTTLIQAVALAGGTGSGSNDARVLVFRTVEGERMAAAFDLDAIRRAEAEDPTIYGNDIIVVPDARGRAVWRDLLSTLPVLGMFRVF